MVSGGVKNRTHTNENKLINMHPDMEDKEWIYRIIGKAVYDGENAKALVTSLQQENTILRNQLEAVTSGFGVEGSGVYSQHKQRERMQVHRTVDRNPVRKVRRSPDTRFREAVHFEAASKSDCEKVNHDERSSSYKKLKAATKVEGISKERLVLNSPGVLKKRFRGSASGAKGSKYQGYGVAESDQEKCLEASVETRSFSKDKLKDCHDGHGTPADGNSVEGKVRRSPETSILERRAEEETSNSKENSCARDDIMKIEDKVSLDRIVAKVQSKENINDDKDDKEMNFWTEENENVRYDLKIVMDKYDEAFEEKEVNTEKAFERKEDIGYQRMNSAKLQKRKNKKMKRKGRC